MFLILGYVGGSQAYAIRENDGVGLQSCKFEGKFVRCVASNIMLFGSMVAYVQEKLAHSKLSLCLALLKATPMRRALYKRRPYCLCWLPVIVFVTSLTARSGS